MELEPSEFQRLRETFFPYAVERTLASKAAGHRFAYYTSAETAYRILDNQEIWLRNSQLMNDFSEIAHGLACVRKAYHGPDGMRLVQALEQWFPGITGEIEEAVNTRIPQILYDTFVTCVSEHLPEEDTRGRLSMWRAYGRSAGIAIVMRGAVMETASNALGAYSSPVFYGTEDDFQVEFRRLVDGILGGEEFVRTLQKDIVVSAIFEALRFAVICTKHPGFCEEREWRVVACPTLYQPPRLRDAIEVVRGSPQRVLKIKLENAPDEHLTGLAIPELIDRIIIGPCQFPQMAALTFGECLLSSGLPEAQRRVVISDIPLRHMA